MKIAVTGSKGYIGKALVKAGAFPIVSDVRNPEGLRDEITALRPDIILHLAAKSDPEFCEKKENRDEVFDVNVRGVHNVMFQSTKLGIPCVLMSTGQIWRGGFWEHDHREHDEKTPPVNVYGISKLGAEFVAEDYFSQGGKIIRSSYVFDAERLSTKIGSLKEGVTLNEPTFIRRSFIYLPEMVRLLLEYCERIKEMPSILHLAGAETCSWFDFMYEVAKQYECEEWVRARRTELKDCAPRPHKAGLDVGLARSLGFRIPSYVGEIERMASEQN